MEAPWRTWRKEDPLILMGQESATANRWLTTTGAHCLQEELWLLFSLQSRDVICSVARSDIVFTPFAMRQPLRWLGIPPLPLLIALLCAYFESWGSSVAWRWFLRMWPMSWWGWTCSERGACSFNLPRPSSLWVEETLFLPVYTLFWGLFSSPTLFAATGQQPTCSWFPFSAEQ